MRLLKYYEMNGMPQDVYLDYLAKKCLQNSTYGMLSDIPYNEQPDEPDRFEGDDNFMNKCFILNYEPTQEFLDMKNTFLEKYLDKTVNTFTTYMPKKKSGNMVYNFYVKYYMIVASICSGTASVIYNGKKRRFTFKSQFYEEYQEPFFDMFNELKMRDVHIISTVKLHTYELFITNQEVKEKFDALLIVKELAKGSY